ncbi:MAG TPA: autotransporter assembly complex family protein [Gammaproteobacteria bacterium]|jgi:translocation and assembly module TamA|nr:autotransporter assembly complex family protein [Gammaproteobacteria bacterium]
MFRLFTFLITLAIFTAPVARAASVVVEIEGVTDALLENVRNTLSIIQYRDDANLGRPWVQRLHGKAESEIRSALKPYGYYRPTVDKALSRRDDGWMASYRIDPGVPVPIRSADVQLFGAGAGEAGFQKLVKAQPLPVGAPLNQPRYDSLKSSLQKRALEQGYFDAQFLRHEIRLDLDAYHADIVLHYDTGARYRLGEVTFEPSSLSDDFLARYVTFKPGENYSTKALLGLQEALTDSDYFSSVNVVAQRERAEDLQVPVNVTVVPHKRNKYTFGLGYGTDTGARASAGWERRLVNKRGHRFATDLRLSEVKNNLSAGYSVPLRNPRTEKLTYSAGYFDSDTDSNRSQTILLGASRTDSRWGSSETLGLSFQREDFSVGGIDDTALLLMPEASWLWVRADDRIYSSRGMRLQLSVRGASEALLSSTTFVQTQLQAKFIQKVFSASRIILRGDAGISYVPDFRELPSSQRFFAGGDQSVRGYDYESLAPTDANGVILGGRNLLVGSAEYEHPIKGKWSAALFVDTGAAIDSLTDRLSTGAGIGLRWRSPIGLIRIDVASALSKDGHPLRLHLVIGPDL